MSEAERRDDEQIAKRIRELADQIKALTLRLKPGGGKTDYQRVTPLWPPSGREDDGSD